MQCPVTHNSGALAGGKYTLEVHYEGILNDQLAGFYRSSSKDPASGAIRWLACTQFEATDARRALPCVDEPAAKAEFLVTLFVQKDLTAVSNMPVSTKALTSKKTVHTNRRTHFERQLRM